MRIAVAMGGVVLSVVEGEQAGGGATSTDIPHPQRAIGTTRDDLVLMKRHPCHSRAHADVPRQRMDACARAQVAQTHCAFFGGSGRKGDMGAAPDANTVHFRCEGKTCHGAKRIRIPHLQSTYAYKTH